MQKGRATLQIFLKRCAIVSLTLFFIVSLYPGQVLALTLDEIQQQKRKAEQKANELKAQTNNKANEVNDLTSVVQQLSDQIKNYQSKITSTQKSIDSNQSAIVDTEHQIQLKQIQLEENMSKQSDAIQTMYYMGRQSTIEALITSDSLSQVVARQQYLTALSEKIESMMKEIKQLKAELEAKRNSLVQRKTELAIQKDQLVAFKSSVDAQKQQQNQLLSASIAEKNKLLADYKEAQSELAKLSKQELDYRRKMAAQYASTAKIGGSAYPYDAIDVPDPWGFYTRECVSYTAWYWNKNLNPSKPFVRIKPPGGDAKKWPELGRIQGYSVTDTPHVGAIIAWTSGTYGHVAIVEAINEDGTLALSDYNYLVDHVYRYTPRVNPSEYIKGPHYYIY